MNLNTSHHFLDTNILLALVLDNDESFDDVKSYLEFDSIHYISNTARNEAKFKINNDKRIFLDLIEFILNYALNNPIDYLKLHQISRYIEKSFLNQYDNMDFPENLPQERFQKLIKSFFKQFQNEINQILIECNNDYLRSLIKQTNLATLLKVDSVSKNFNCISFIESGDYISNLKKIGLDHKDAVLLDESYYLSRTLNDSVDFITFDKGILKLKNLIFEVLLKSVSVSNPVEIIEFNS